MIEQCVRVTRVERGRASIESLREPHDCSRCAGSGVCRNAWLWRLSPRRAPQVVIDGSAGVRMGDELVMSIDERVFLRGIWLVYGVPLCGLLLGTTVGAWLENDGATRSWLVVVLAFAGLLGGAMLGRLLQWRSPIVRDVSWRPRRPATP